MQAISDRAGEVQGAISDLADLTTDWANENIDAVNSMSARISWLTDKTVLPLVRMPQTRWI